MEAKVKLNRACIHFIPKKKLIKEEELKAIKSHIKKILAIEETGPTQTVLTQKTHRQYRK